jgi:hypothetical protein
MLQKIHISPQWPYLVDKSPWFTIHFPIRIAGHLARHRGNQGSLGTPWTLNPALKIIQDTLVHQRPQVICLRAVGNRWIETLKQK